MTVVNREARSLLALDCNHVSSKVRESNDLGRGRSFPCVSRREQHVDLTFPVRQERVCVGHEDTKADDTALSFDSLHGCLFWRCVVSLGCLTPQCN